MLTRVLAFVFVALAALPVGAQRCPAPEGADSALVEQPATRRAAFLLREARAGYDATVVWTAVYATAYVGLTAGQLAVVTVSAAEDDQDGKTTYAVGAASSLIGVLSFFALPAAIRVEMDEIEAVRHRALSGDCEALAELERRFASGVGSEDFGTSWLMHVGGALFNIAVGLFLGLGYDQWVSGAISAGSGIVVGEIQIWTRPTPMSNAWRMYEAGEVETVPHDPAPRLSIGGAPAGVPGSATAGLSLGAAF